MYFITREPNGSIASNFSCLKLSPAPKFSSRRLAYTSGTMVIIEMV